MTKKSQSLSELSLEDLLQSIEGQNTKEIHTFSDPVLSFIQAFELGTGKNLVSNKVLHKIFRKWYKVESFSSLKFTKRLNEYLVPVRQPSAVLHFYHCPKKIFDLVSEFETKHKRTGTLTPKFIYSHMEKFLTQTGLDNGHIYIEQDIFYYVYNRWIDKTKKTRRISEQNFGRICTAMFTTKRRNESEMKWFGVNDKIKELISKEEINRWRQGRSEKEKRNKKKSK